MRVIMVCGYTKILLPKGDDLNELVQGLDETKIVRVIGGKYVVDTDEKIEIIIVPDSSILPEEETT